MSDNPRNLDYEGVSRDWLARFPDSTAAAYRRDLSQFAEWLERDPLTASRRDVQGWIGALRDLKRSAATIRRKASSVSSFLAYAVEEQLVEVNAAAHTRRPRGGGDVKLGLTIDQTSRLLEAAGDLSSTAHALILLLVTTGLRISEAVGADLTDLTDDGGHQVLRVTRKGGAQGLVPVAPSVLEAITDAAGDRETGALFTTTTGRRLSRDAAGDLIAAAARGAGLEHVHPHQLRHTCASQAIAAGEPLEAVQALLGHASPATTQRYLRAINRLDRTAGTAATLAETFAPKDAKP